MAANIQSIEAPTNVGGATSDLAQAEIELIVDGRHTGGHEDVPLKLDTHALGLTHGSVYQTGKEPDGHLLQAGFRSG